MNDRLSTGAICRLIDALLPSGYPVIGEVAKLLRTSPRSLQRMLNEEGVSYSDLVDHCRSRAACNYLNYTQDPIRDVAAILGYRNTSSFTRAFRRWTGMAPRTYRSHSRVSQGAHPDRIVELS